MEEILAITVSIKIILLFFIFLVVVGIIVSIRYSIITYRKIEPDGTIHEISLKR